MEPVYYLILYRYFCIIWRDEVELGYKMSELNISLILSGDKNKGEYISSENLVKYEVEARTNY